MAKCECFEQLSKELRKKYEDDKGYIDWILTIGKESDVLPRMRFVYHKLRKDKSRQKKESEITLAPSYCPFCGRKYEGYLLG